MQKSPFTPRHAFMSLCWLFALAPPLGAQPVQLIDNVGRELDTAAKALIESIENPSKNVPFDIFKINLIAALDNIPALLKRVEEARFLEAKRDETRARLLPQVSLSTGAGRTNPESGATGGAETHTLSVSQLVFDFGTSLRSLDATKKTTQAAEARLRGARSESLLQLIQATTEVRRATQRLELSTAFVSSRRQFLELIRQKEGLGASSSADIIRAESKVFEAADELPFAVRRLNDARSRYKELFGGVPSQPIPELQLPKVTGFADLTPEDAVARLSEVIEAELNLDAASLEFGASKSATFGGIALEGTASKTKTPNSPNREESSIFLRYKVDIFSGFAQSARIDQQGAKRKEAQWELDRVRREALKQLEDAFAEYQAQQSSVTSRIAVLRSAKASGDIAKELFLYNRGSLTDVFKGQEDYLLAARNLVDSNTEFKISFYTMLHRFDRLLAVVDDPI